MCVCVCVCVSVCLLSHISPLERRFVLKITVTYSAGNGGPKICGISLKMLCSKVMVSLVTVASYRADEQFFDNRAFLSSLKG